MAEILLDTQSGPATPASGQGFIFVDTTAKILVLKDDTGTFKAASANAAVTNQAGFAADTYLANSNILIPSFGLQAKTVFRWQISASKTAAGVATPVYILRIGAAGSVADAAIITLTGPAQTAIADVGTLNILATVRNIGAAGAVQATAWWDHRGTVASSTNGTGFANDGTGHVEAASAGVDMTALAGKFVGLSLNGGASAAWTVTQAIAEARW